MFVVTRKEVAEYLAEGKRLRFNHNNGPDSNGGFIVEDAEHYPGEPHWIADVQEGWAQGVYEPVCEAGDEYLFTNYLNNSEVWFDYGHWLKATIVEDDAAKQALRENAYKV